MERIRLTKDEKRVLRWVTLGRSGQPQELDKDRYFQAVVGLTEKGLVKSVTNYDEVDSVTATAKGRVYCSQNPHLWNPTNWAKLAAIGAMITAIATVAALFDGCSN